MAGSVQNLLAQIVALRHRMRDLQKNLLEDAPQASRVLPVLRDKLNEMDRCVSDLQCDLAEAGPEAGDIAAQLNGLGLAEQVCPRLRAADAVLLPDLLHHSLHIASDRSS